MAPRHDVTIRGKDETKPAFDSAIKNAESFGERAKASLLNPLNVAKGAAVAFAATIGGMVTSAISGLARASVESAAAADAAWGRVQSAVQNVGANFDVLRGSLDQLFTAIQKTTRYSDDDAADAFATLVSISGDYTRSTQNLALVTDIAAAKKISLASAAELVGKVMAGETGHLKRLGIVIREGDDAMGALRSQFSGFAERDGKTLEGQLAAIANAWDNVKEAVGRALTSFDDTGKGTNILVEKLNALGSWIDENKVDLQESVTLVGDLLGALNKLGLFSPKSYGLVSRDETGLTRMLRRVGLADGPDTSAKDAAELEAFQAQHAKNVAARDEKLAQAERDRLARLDSERKAREAAASAAEKAEGDRIKAIQTELDRLTELSKVVELSLAQKRRQLELDRELRRIAIDPGATATDANRALGVRYVADQAEEDRRRAASLGPTAPLPVSFTGLKPEATFTGPVAAPITATYESKKKGFGEGVVDAMTERMGGAGALEDVSKGLGDLDERMQRFTGNTLSGMFEAWEQGIDDVIRGHQSLSVVIPALMRKAVAGALHAEGTRDLLNGLAAVARGILTLDAKAVGGGAKLAAAGMAELAAASMLGGKGAGGSSGGGGGGSGGGISSSAFQQSQGELDRHRKTTVILRGKGINFNNPDDLEALRAAIRDLGETRDLEFIVQD